MVIHFEARDMLIFVFSCWEKDLGSNLTVYYFKKSNGTNANRKIGGIKGKITSMEFSQS